MKPNIKVFDSPELLAISFAEYFAEEVSKKSRVNIALSGGSTPKIIFQALASEYSNRIEWNKVHFYWGDERCVPPDSAESNYKMTKDFLLDEIRISETNIFRIRGEDESHKEAIRYSNEICNSVHIVNDLPCFDFIMLGLGEDGHTASIFPDRLDLFHSSKICEAVQNPLTHQNRITLTGRVINNAHAAAFFINGSQKAGIVKKIFNDSDAKEKFPAANVKLSNGTLYWYLDKASFQ